MIGDIRMVLEVVSKIEEELGADIVRLNIIDDSGVVKVEMKVLLPQNFTFKTVKQIKNVINETFDVVGAVLNGRSLTINAYFLSGKES